MRADTEGDLGALTCHIPPPSLVLEGMKKRILILGGGYAGSLAAIRIARRGIAVTLIDAGAGLVDRIRLHQRAAGDDISPIPYTRLFRGLPIDVVRARVLGIDRDRKLVTTTSGELPYDRLLYTLGSITPAMDVPHDAKTLTIAGAGLTGIELAAEFAERFPAMKVTLVDAGTIGGDLSDGARTHLVEWMRAHGVTLRENERAETADVWCTGFAVSPIARDAGLAVNARGQIIVDDHLRSSDPSIFAAGDAAAFGDVRMGCVSAMPMAAYAADFIAGTTTDPFNFAFTIRCISLGRRDGMVQFVRADDSARDRFLTGRPAAWVKELICRYVLLSIRMERKGVPYRWPTSKPTVAFSSRSRTA